MKNQKTLFSKKFLVGFFLTMLLTFSAQPTYAWKFMGTEEEYLGSACGNDGRCWQATIVRIYVFGICIATDYVVEECYQ